MKTISYQEKLTLLRTKISQEKLDGFLVPRTDEYLNEMIAPYAQRLAWLTGFTGSAGLGIILQDKACVMSDGRYTIQLTQEVDGDLYELQNSQEITPEKWLKKNVPQGVVLGYDPKLHTPDFIERVQKKNIKLQPVHNLMDDVWEDQPVEPRASVFAFPDKIAGKTAAQKIQELQNILQKQDCDAVIITALDSIAWLLNIRGNDIENIPVAMSTLIVLQDNKAQWFIAPEKLSEDVKNLENHVVQHSPEDMEEFLNTLKGQAVWYDPKRSPVYYKSLLTTVGAKIYEENDPCIVPRSCKTSQEQEAMRQAHILDGIALVKFLHWFDDSSASGTLDELQAEEKLEDFRKEAPEYKEPSFNTIFGFGSNGAIVHYRASAETNLQIKNGNLLLLDSGGQYHYGTTDITRTIVVGEPTAEMIKCNTLVLKGHVALATARFSKDTQAKELDILARAPLMAEGLNYSHGTGHGVGCYLSVHEEASNISPRGEDPLAEGMIISNEPGYYKEGEFGIRIESLILTKSEGDQFYFETITLVPIDKKLIDKSLLSGEEIVWLNDYHADVFEKISPSLNEETKSWLKEATKPL